MNNAAIIDYNKDFSFFHELLFKVGNLKSRYIEEEILIEEVKIKVFKVPVSLRTLKNEKKRNIIFNKFISFLKENNITKIIISDEAKKLSGLDIFFRNNFFIFDGKSIIKFKFSYIIKRYIKTKNIYSPEIVIFSNNFDNFYEYFKLIFKNYNVSTLVTDYKNLFLSFSDEMFSEYGFLINIINEENFTYNNDLFVINIDIDSEKSYFDIDLNKLSLIFMKNENFKNVYKFFKITDEKVLEFIIYVIYGGLEKSKITEFFNKYNIRIVKINKK